MKKSSINRELSLANKTELLNDFTEKKSKQYLAIVTLATISFLLPELALADVPPDAFGNILTKTTGWVTGSAGKLVTFISLAMAGIMGVAGFPTKYVVGALGTGLLLSSSKTIVEMLF